eukprot:Pompholyxophrys_punicea_v1_NODE_652_length_1504_cov_5.139741.p1 type:complete len:280 gc:universal NODE_652_length_1504_cov_5.139741:1287-448(-)
MALSRFELVCESSIRQGVQLPVVDPLSENVNVVYSNDSSAKEMLLSFSSVLSRDMKERLKKSPFIALMTDESTDVAIQSNLILYIQYLRGEALTPAVEFLELSEQTATDADSITKTIISKLQEWGLSEKLIAFASDGASVMTGAQNGVAHRLNLVCNDAVHSIPLCEAYEATMNSICTHFCKSSKRLHLLHNIQEQIGERLGNITRTSATRWLSRNGSNVTTRKHLASLFKLFWEESSESETALKIFKQITSFQFLCILHFLGDILGDLATMSKFFSKM